MDNNQLASASARLRVFERLTRQENTRKQIDYQKLIEPLGFKASGYDRKLRDVRYWNRIRGS